LSDTAVYLLRDRREKYSSPNQAKTVHDLLLQKSDGKFELIVWSEKLNNADEIEVTFDDKHHNITVFNVTQGTEPVSKFENTISIRLSAKNTVFIIEIEK
jgi:hypothetical protein